MNNLQQNQRKKGKYLFLIAGLWLCGLFCTLSSLAQELRGAWIHSPVGIEDGRGWDATVKVLAENGFNALFANFAWAGCAEYPSGVVEPHPSLYDDAGDCHDRLQECLDACRKYGVQLHVWLVACNLGHRTPERVQRQFREEGRVQVDASGAPSTYLAPHLEENRELLAKLVQEILERYPVAGIHLDYIRYPAGQYDFSASARADFERWASHPVEKWPEDCQAGGKNFAEFREWRRENVTELVRRVKDVVKSIRPEAMLSAAVYGYWPSAREGIAQDAALWAREGLVDALCPMNYSADAWEAGTWLRKQLRETDGALPIFTGLANYKTATAEDLAEQIRDGRRFGADGFVTFQLKANFADKWLPELHKTVTKGREKPPQGNEPRPKALWRRAPKRLPWRFLRVWLRGDRLRCTVTFPEGHCPVEDGTAGNLRIRLLRNGEVISSEERGKAGTAARAFVRPDGTMLLELVPGQKGFYRWEFLWQDEAGGENEWRSSTRQVWGF